MVDILIWVGVALAVIAVWLLAGRSSDRPTPGDGPPPSDTIRGPMI